MIYDVPEGATIHIDGIPCHLYHKIKVETNSALPSYCREDKMVAARGATKFVLILIAGATLLAIVLSRLSCTMP